MVKCWQMSHLWLALVCSKILLRNTWTLKLVWARLSRNFRLDIIRTITESCSFLFSQALICWSILVPRQACRVADVNACSWSRLLCAGLDNTSAVVLLVMALTALETTWEHPWKSDTGTYTRWFSQHGIMLYSDRVKLRKVDMSGDGEEPKWRPPSRSTNTDVHTNSVNGPMKHLWV